jgi:mono/diheme cytochrome c family protein
VAQHCAKCHGIAVPKGDFYLDGKPGMRAEDITKAIRMVAADHMPKDRKLTREQKNELLQDLLQLEFTEATPAQPPEPVQPPSPSPPGD